MFEKVFINNETDLVNFLEALKGKVFNFKSSEINTNIDVEDQITNMLFKCTNEGFLQYLEGVSSDNKLVWVDASDELCQKFNKYLAINDFLSIRDEKEVASYILENLDTLSV